MAPTREIASPMITVKRDETREDPMIRLRFSVSQSKFGPVEILLYEYEAEAFAREILDAL